MKLLKKLMLAFSVVMAVGMITGCENFLNGANIREDLREAIEIANSEPQTYYVIVEEGSGKATPDYVRVKKNESFPIIFVTSDDWKFDCWEAVDRTTGKVIADAIKFDNPKNPETKAKIINPLENLAIHAKCIAMPAVVSVSPSGEATQKLHTPIEITFNRSMEATDASETESIFNFNNIIITYGSTEMKDYFEQPYFKASSDKKTLVIKPKARNLQGFMKAKKVNTLKLNVEVKESIYVLDNKVPLYLLSNSKNSFQITYNRDIDEVKPQIGDNGYLYFSRKPDITPADTNNHFLKETGFSTEDTEKILKNRTNGTVYIYGKYFEADSGVQSVIVREKRTHEPIGQTKSGAVYETQYTDNSTDAVFIRDGQYTSFCIEYHLSSLKGQILIQVSVTDFCDNNSDTEELSVIYTNVESFMGFTVYNGGPFANQYSGENAFSIQDFDSSNFKTLRICTFHPFTGPDSSEHIYGGIEIEAKDLTITCSYIDKNNKPQKETLKEVSSLGWGFASGTEMICNLNVDSLEGLTVHISISDDFDNKKEMDFTFPNVPIFNVTNKTNNSMTLNFKKSTGQSIAVMHEEIENGEKVEKWSPINGNGTATITKGIDYKARTLYVNGDYCLVSESTPVYSVDKLSVPEGYTVPSVELKSQNAKLAKGKPFYYVPYYDPPYYIQQLDVTVTIKDDSWTKNKYDSIYMSWEKSDGSKKNEYFFPTNQTELTIQCYTQDLASYDYIIKVYGIKNGYESQPSIIPVPKITGTEYDNDFPTFTKQDSNDSAFDTIYYKFKDTISYPKSAYLITTSGKRYCLYDNADNTEHEITLDFPSWYLREEEDKENKLRFEITDTAGNTTEVRKINSVIFDQTINAPQYSSPYWKFTPTDIGYRFHEWDAANNKWGAYKIRNTKDNYQLTNNNFIKVIPIKKSGFVNEGSSAPQYFYITTSTITSQPENKYIVSTNSNDSVFIASDCNVFIHTVGTKKNFSECSSWTTEEWGFKHFETGDAVYKYSSTDRYQKLYTIPVDQLLEAGCNCYVVIVHFSDGTVQKSEVFEL